MRQVGNRPAKLNEKKSDRELEQEIKKTKETFFVGGTTWKFCSGGKKVRNASCHQGENERQWKQKSNKNTYYISSIKRVTRGNQEVSGSFTL